VTPLLNEYLSKFKLRIHFTDDEAGHWLVPRPGVVDAFVVDDPTTHKITGLISFFHINNKVLKDNKHDEIRVAYSYYNVPGEHGMEALMRDALILAKNNGADVMNALKLMDNEEIFEKLRFGAGDGTLNYYLYNWGCPKMEDRDVALVLH